MIDQDSLEAILATIDFPSNDKIETVRSQGNLLESSSVVKLVEAIQKKRTVLDKILDSICKESTQFDDGTNVGLFDCALVLLSLLSIHESCRKIALEIFRTWGQRKLLPIQHILILLNKPTQSTSDFQSCTWKLCCYLIDKSSEIITSTFYGQNNFLSGIEYFSKDVSCLLEGLYQVCNSTKQEFMSFHLISLCTKITSKERPKRPVMCLPPLGMSMIFMGGTAPIKCRVGDKLQVWVPNLKSSSSSSSASSSSRVQQKDDTGSSSNTQYPTTALMISCLTASTVLRNLSQCSCILTAGVRINELVNQSLEEISNKSNFVLPCHVVMHRFLSLLNSASDVVQNDESITSALVESATKLISSPPLNTNFNLVNLLLGAQRHLHKYSPSLTEVLFSLPDDGQSLDRIILELKLDYLYKNSSISSLGVMLADAIINNYSDQQESSFLNTLISLLQAIENANSAILDSTICPSLQVYTKALCSQLRQADKHDSNIHSILLTGASSLLDIFLNQFDFLIRLDDVADRVSVLHHTGYVLSSTDLNMNMEEYADLPESTGLWYIWRLQTVSTTIIDSYFNADTGSTRAAINTDFETLLETTRQLSMLSTALQLNQTSSNEHLTNWIDAFQLSHKTFRSFQSKYSDNGFNVPVDPVGFLTVTARYSEKFSLNKWIFSASSSFCASSLVTDTLRQSAAVQLPDAIKAIKLAWECCLIVAVMSGKLAAMYSCDSTDDGTLYSTLDTILCQMTKCRVFLQLSNLPINDSNALSSIKLSGSAGKSKKSSDDPSTPYLTQSLLYHRHVISGFLTGVSRDLPVDVITCYLRSLLDSDAYLTDAALISIGIIVQKLVFSYSKDLISKSDDNNGSTYDFDKSFLLSQYPIAVTSTSTESCTDIAVWSDIESVLFRYFCLTSSILERQRYIRQSRHSDVFEDDDDENENDDVDIVGDDIADNHRESKKITSLGYSGCTLILVLNYVSVLTWIRHNKITWTQDNSFVDSAQWNDLTRQFGSRSVFQGVSSQIQTTLDSQVAIPGYLILSEIAAAVSSFRDNCASVAWKLFTMLFPDLLDLSVSTSHSSYNLANTSMLLGYSELLPYLHVTLNRCESYQQNILELSSSWEPKFTQPIATQLSSLHAMFYPSATGNKGKTFHRSVASVWYFCMAWWNQESSSQGRISGVSCLLNEVLGKALGQIKVVKRSESNTSSKAKISTKRKRKRDKRYHTKKNSFRFDDDSYSGSDADSIDSASVNDDEDDDDDMDRFGDINDEDNEDNNNSSRKSTDGVVDFNHVNLIQQKYLKHDESLQNENTILFASISTTNLEPHYYIATGLLPLLIMTTKPCVPNPDVENKSKNIAQVVSPYCDFIASCQLFIWTLRSIKQQMTRSESASFLLTHTPYSCRTFRLIILAIEGSLAKILAWRSQPLPADTSNSNLMTDEGDLEDSDWQSIDYLFPVFEISIASCELVIDYTNLWKMFLVKGGKSFEAPRRMGPSMMKLQQVAEMAVARIRRSGDIHQLDLSELSKPQVGSELNDMFRGTHYDINTFLARRERELSSTISFPLQSSSSEPNNSVEFTPVANYFYDPMSISSNEAEINGNERQIMVESDSNRSGGWGLYNYSA